MYLTADNLAHYLMARGLIDGADVIRGDYLAIENSRRNRNFRVLRRNAPSFFVKQVPTVMPATVESLRREADCCRLVAQVGSLASLRTFMPQLVDFNDAAHIVVTNLIAGGQNLNEHYNNRQNQELPLGRLQGRALGSIHAATAASLRAIDEVLPLPRRQPWFFNALHRTEIVLPNISPTMGRAVAALKQLPDVMTALASVQVDWMPSCLAHNDVKWDNIVIEPRPDGAVLKLVDWELADIGDPSWDVACVLAAYVQYWLFYVHPAREAASVELGDRKFAGLRRESAAFWNEYLRQVHLTAADAQRLLVRSVHLAGVRLLQTFLETQGVADAPLPTSPLLLNVARHILANVELCQREVFGIEPAAAVADGLLRVAPTLRADIAIAAEPAPGLAQVAPARPAIADDLEHRLLRICESVRIETPASFRLGNSPAVTIAPPSDQPRSGSQASGASATAQQIATRPLAEALWPALYWNFYTSERATMELRELAAGEADGEFVERLSAANASRDRRDRAWEIYGLESNGAAHVRKGNNFRLFVAGGYTMEQDRPVAVGERVSVHVQREARSLLPGFYFAFGETVGSEFDDGQLARIYFNLGADGAIALVAWLTKTFNRYEVPFRFKCLNRRDAYEAKRADAGVLYVSRRFLDVAVRLIADEYEGLRPGLHAECCLFAKPLAPGICAAEDPRNGESFGQSRMRLVSRAIVDAWSNGVIDPRGRLAAIGAAFASAGLSLQRPYLNPGNAELCGWPS